MMKKTTWGTETDYKPAALSKAMQSRTPQGTTAPH